jgi:hypothetical protein
VGKSFAGIALSPEGSFSTTQRTVRELEAKPYIMVVRATNQHELSLFKILKYDVEEPDSVQRRVAHARAKQLHALKDLTAGKLRPVLPNPRDARN